MPPQNIVMTKTIMMMTIVVLMDMRNERETILTFTKKQAKNKNNKEPGAAPTAADTIKVI